MSDVWGQKAPLLIPLKTFFEKGMLTGSRLSIKNPDDRVRESYFRHPQPQGCGVRLASEIKPCKNPVKKCKERHRKHHRAKKQIPFEQIHHVYRFAVVKRVNVQIFEMC